MRLLLDASALLGVVFGFMLGEEGRAAIADPLNDVWVSAVSPYELEWKKHIGKLSFPDVPDWEHDLASRGYLIAPLTIAQSVAAARLPRLHRDPWDRFVVAQALSGSFTVVTKDREIVAYGVPTLW